MPTPHQTMTSGVPVPTLRAMESDLSRDIPHLWGRDVAWGEARLRAIRREIAKEAEQDREAMKQP